MIAFRNSGTTRKSDRYTWELSEPTGDQHFYYLEPQNVTAAHGLWGIWGETTKANSVTRGMSGPKPGRVWVPTLQIETFRRLARVAKRLAFGVILRFCVVKRVQFNLLRYLI